MLKIKNYVKAESLEQAYELNQKRTACVLGGMVWLKMGNRVVTTAIDLSGLGLDTITETESEFVIGCMTPLRDLELHQGLHTYTKGAIRESLRHIVGVQFRNLAGMETMSSEEKKTAVQKFADYAARKVPTFGNMRGSAEYRTLLVKVLTRRALEAVGGMTDEN